MENKSDSTAHDRAIFYALLLGAALIWIDYLFGIVN